MRPRLFLFTILLLRLQAPTHAVEPFAVESPEPLLEEWRWQTLHTARTEIHSMWVDSLGVLLASAVGLEAYDGYQWQGIDGPDSLLRASISRRLPIVSLMRDRAGNIWIAARSGRISRFDGLTWQVYSEADGLPSGYMWRSTLYEAADGTVWAAFNRFGFNADDPELTGGLRRFDGHAWQSVSVPVDTLYVLSITATKDGALWLATPHGSWRGMEGNWSFQPLSVASGTLYDLAEDSAGGLWGVGDGGIWQLVEDTWQVVVPRQFVSNLWQTVDGTLWACTAEGEVCRREPGKPWACEDSGQVQGWVFGGATADGSILMASSRRVVRFRADGPWSEFTSPGGLSGGVEAADGSIWFVTQDAAIQYHDGEWLEHGPADGFMDAIPLAVHGDTDGGVWFVGIKEMKSVVSHWKGGLWRVYTVADGLIDDIYQAPRIQSNREFIPGTRDNTFDTPLLITRAGDVWFVGAHDGSAAVCRFDGTHWQRLLAAPEQAGSHLNLAFEASDGSLWFGSHNYQSQYGGIGLFRFVEEKWTHFSTEDGLAHDMITGISEWPAGTLWVGSAGGVNQLQLASEDAIVGEAQIDFSDDLPKVRAFCPTDEAMWYGFLPNRAMGAVRVDGDGTRFLTVSDGLPSDEVNQILSTATGDLWFTASDGISRYRDGYWTRWTSEEHGFPRGWYFNRLHEVSDGTLWLDLSGPAGARVAQVRPAADVASPETTLHEAPSLLATDGVILLSWSATDFWNETATNHLQYQYRLDGDPWSAPDRARSVRLAALEAGTHRFEVRAIDAFGNIDPTPTAHEFVVEPPWWLNPWFLLVATALASTAVVQTVRVLQGDRRLREEERQRFAAQRRLADELERELDSARDMQMALMPASPPNIRGMSVAGGCQTANHVGGDLFQYFNEDALVIAMADVTGHAMEAAIPVVMFSGILDNQMEQPKPLPDLFGSLNRSLCRSLGDHKFICFTMAEIEGKTLRLASCGNPYPLHFHNGEATELRVDGYPLGVREDTQYDAIEAQLHEGDYLVLYSDGIPETINPSEEMFGYDRTIETVREACMEGISAEDLVERLMSRAREFAGDEAQADDMTCVVVRVE